MKPASRRWTSDEITEFDRLLDAGKEAADIAVALNRTRSAIYARRQRLYRKSAREAKDKFGLGLKAKGAKP
jgi:IS30 family transposase